MNQVKIGKFIAKCRKEQRMTQDELAYQLGVSSKTVSRWETGRTLPDYSLLELLSSKLNISILELLNGQKDYDNDNLDDLVDGLIHIIISKETIKKILVSVIFTLIIIILYVMYNVNRFQGFNNSYLFDLSNRFAIIPFSNIITLFNGGSVEWFVKNLVVNILISVIVIGWILSITKKSKSINYLLIITNIVFELSKALLLIGMFDIDDLMIRLLGCYVIYKMWLNRQHQFIVCDEK